MIYLRPMRFYLMSAWVKFTGEHARLLRMRRWKTDRLFAEADRLTLEIEDRERRLGFVVAELNRREAKWPEES